MTDLKPEDRALSESNRALIANTNASLSRALMALAQCGRLGQDAVADLNALLDAARAEGLSSPSGGGERGRISDNGTNSVSYGLPGSVTDDLCGSRDEPTVGATAALASVPCGGCGATEDSQRCIGCLHDFGTPDSAWVRKYAAPAKDSLSGPTGEVGGVEPVAWRYEFSTPRQEDGYRDGSTVWHVGYSAEPPKFPVRNLKPLYERGGPNA